MKIKSVFLGLLCACGCISQLQAQQVDPEMNRQLQKLNHFVYVLEQQYVDSLSASRIVEDAIRGALKALDPHSVYMTKAEALAMQEQFRGHLEGIGVEMSMMNDTLLITRAIHDGPADRAGIVPNDMLLAIDGTPVAGVRFLANEAMRKIKGEKGSFVTLTVKRFGEGAREVKIERNTITRPCLESSYLVKEGIGYIRLSRFMATTTKEFEEAMGRLNADGRLHSLILDLRDNGGGFMTEALKMSDHFLGDKSLLLYTEGREPRRDYLATKAGIFEKGHLVILVNQNSASSSEIVSGAVQDWDRGMIVGRRTFGKGLVQAQYPLSDSSMVNITTARYHTPTGRLIQKAFLPGEGDEYREDAVNRYKGGELFSKDSIHPDKTLLYKTLRKGRDVYGGGGITPDVFVPVDTVKVKYSAALGQAGIIHEVVMTYLRENRKLLLQKYPDFVTFRQSYVVPESLLKSIDGKAKKQYIRDEHNSAAFLKNHVKAAIALRIYSSSEYYNILNDSDPDFLKAVDVLERWEVYAKGIGE